MAERWMPSLQVSAAGDSCRLTLCGLSYGNGRTLQEAADDLVPRLLGLALGLHTNGFRFSSELGPPDRRLLDFLWELGEMAARGEDVRERVLGPTGECRFSPIRDEARTPAPRTS